jgi:chloride channel 3/4/5
VTKAIGERLGKGGIADRMIWFNGFPFLDNKEEHTFGVPVQRVMTREMTVLPTSGLLLKDVDTILSETKFKDFQSLSRKAQSLCLDTLAGQSYATP